ncbi:hypothetical protein NIES2107_22450 [Nostoc carneum NIES-2107]|nr:hypothetical protein NIES2107_22450 [Nostoc carneum NIES-2107]
MVSVITQETLKNKYGYTYSALGDKWWSNVASTPVENNPLLYDDNSDPRGRRGSIEKANAIQSEKGIFFLLGTPAGGKAERSVVVSKDSLLFFPLVNQAAENTTTKDAIADWGIPLTEVQLKQIQTGQITNPNAKKSTLVDLVHDLIATIEQQHISVDGAGVSFKTQDLRTITQPAPWSDLPRYFLPKNNVFGYDKNSVLADPNLYNPTLYGNENQGYPTLGQLSHSLWKIPFVQGGDYAALKLSDKESHTLEFGGYYKVADVTQDTTYNILNPIYGTSGKDYLRGTQGEDYIIGKKGKDILTGLGGNDLLIGGDDEDILNGGYGDDELWGDKGKDSFIFKPGYGSDKIFDLERGEKIDISAFHLHSKDISKLELGIHKIELASGLTAQEIDFGVLGYAGDKLTLVGLNTSEKLAICSQNMTLG